MAALDGKVALVTGVGTQDGIGRAIAMRLAADGADVAATNVAEQASAEWGGLPAIVGDIEAMGRRAVGVLADVSDSGDVDAMTRRVVATLGRVDILVNSAAASVGGDRVPVVELEESDWDRVQRVNAKGTFLCCQAVARRLIEQGDGGRIINISSRQGLRGSANFGAYCASKFAIIGLTQSLALELAAHGVTVNAVCPGPTDTQRISDLAVALASGDVSREQARERLVERYSSELPLGRMGRASDVAGAVAYLASPDASFVTGVSLPVAGGGSLG